MDKRKEVERQKRALSVVAKETQAEKEATAAQLAETEAKAKAEAKTAAETIAKKEKETEKVQAEFVAEQAAREALEKKLKSAEEALKVGLGLRAGTRRGACSHGRKARPEAEQRSGGLVRLVPLLCPRPPSSAFLRPPPPASPRPCSAKRSMLLIYIDHPSASTLLSERAKSSTWTRITTSRT